MSKNYEVKVRLFLPLLIKHGECVPSPFFLGKIVITHMKERTRNALLMMGLTHMVIESSYPHGLVCRSNTLIANLPWKRIIDNIALSFHLIGANDRKL